MFQGSFVAIVTPFTESNQVDYSAFEQLLEWHIAAGTAGIVVLGTTGESPTVTAAEREALIRFSVDVVNKRVPVIIGTGTNSTASTLALTQQAKDLGADAALVVTPYYNKPPQKALIAHFKAVAQIDIPQMLYNVPARTGCDLLPESIMALQDEKNIVAVKEATGDVARVTQLRKLGCHLDLLSGEDSNVVGFLQKGGQGVVSVSANVAPAILAELCQAWLDKDDIKLNSLAEMMRDLNQVLFCQSNPIPVKYALAKMGKISPHIRLPLLALDTDYHGQVDQVLQQLNLVENT